MLVAPDNAAPKLPARAARSSRLRLLVRLRRAWRGTCEILGFLRAAALAVVDAAIGYWPEDKRNRQNRR